jgi:pyruvate-formate lyase-activating enzyme
MIDKKPNESYQEWRDRVIDKISPSFCGAKWYNATIWLNSGSTASCHHPPAHKIPLEEVKSNYKAIHNTKYKKMVRKQMQCGERPKECEYCWKVEDLGPNNVSDRVYKTVIYTEDQIKEASEMDWQEDVNLKTLEIAFDANCNYACSYCNASFSTTWQNDIRKDGAYQNLVSDGARAFQQDGKWAMPYGKKNEGNPYVDAFFKWWESDLQHTLQELRVTGGEATMSQDFWRLLNWWQSNKDCDVRLAVNSNLGTKPELIDRLAKESHAFKEFDLYTSNEAFGSHAEYIRDGLIWDTWLGNIHKMMEQGNVRELHMMMTINALCLFSITEFMYEMIKLKESYGQFAPAMSFNILRFPSFQSAVTLPQDIKKRLADNLENWLENIGKKHELFFDMEQDGVSRLINYLREVEVGHQGTSSIETRERDFKSFYSQYDIRRNKLFENTFPEDVVKWYKSIPDTNLQKLQSIVDGDSTKGNMMKKELEERAKKEGWVMNPQGPNPGSQEYKEA